MLGCIAGLIPPAIILTLLYRYGIWEIMLGRTDLRLILWPFSVMLPLNWCCTVSGVLTTMASVASNCLMYASLLLLVRLCAKTASARKAQP